MDKLNVDTLPAQSTHTQSAQLPPAMPLSWGYQISRIHDDAGFAWLNSLCPAEQPSDKQTARCFGFDVSYSNVDVLAWFPDALTLAIPFVETPPPRYFFICNEGGQRWWLFVVLRDRAASGTALVFDVDPSVLLFGELGLRETAPDPRTGLLVARRDFAYPPEPAILCPATETPIRYERFSPRTREFFVLNEWADGQPGRAINRIEFIVGTPAMNVGVRLNTDEGLMRFAASLA